MKIKTIFISNINEIDMPLFVHRDKKWSYGESLSNFALSDRDIYSINDNRLLITTWPLDKNFTKDTAELLKFKNFSNLSPKVKHLYLCEAILKDKKLLELIITLIKNDPKTELVAYAVTPFFVKLVNYLKDQKLKFELPEYPLPGKEWTSDYFNSKAGFRQATYFLDKGFPPMPEGFICKTKEEILGWAGYFLKRSNGFVLKNNRGTAGYGVKIVKGQVDLEKTLSQDQAWEKDIVVVEDLIKADLSVGGGNPNIELKIGNGKISPLYTCGMRITPEGVFCGIEMGKNALPAGLNKLLLKAGKSWAGFLQKTGFQGYFDLDCIYGQDGKTYPLESNVRRTGGTHIYEMGLRLLGKNFLKNYYIISNLQNIKAELRKISYLNLKKRLSAFLYPLKGKKEGVLLINYNLVKRGSLGYAVIGPNKTRVAEIEEEFLQLL